MYRFNLEDPDDGWQPVRPGDMAEIDQLEAKYRMLLKRMLTAQQDITLAAMTGNGERAIAAGRVFAEVMNEMTPDEYPRFISFMSMSVLSLTKMLDDTRKAVVNGITELVDGLPEYQRSVILETIWTDPNGQRETFITGTGQELVAVHSAESCIATWCVVHNPAPGPWIQWPTWWPSPDMGVRMFFRKCPHELMHPAVEDMILNGWDARHEDCDGCPCFHLDCDEIRHPDSGEVLGWMEKTSG